MKSEERKKKFNQLYKKYSKANLNVNKHGREIYKFLFRNSKEYLEEGDDLFYHGPSTTDEKCLRALYNVNISPKKLPIYVNDKLDTNYSLKKYRNSKKVRNKELKEKKKLDFFNDPQNINIEFYSSFIYSHIEDTIEHDIIENAYDNEAYFLTIMNRENSARNSLILQQKRFVNTSMSSLDSISIDIQSESSFDSGLPTPDSFDSSRDIPASLFLDVIQNEKDRQDLSEQIFTGKDIEKSFRKQNENPSQLTNLKRLKRDARRSFLLNLSSDEIEESSEIIKKLEANNLNDQKNHTDDNHGEKPSKSIPFSSKIPVPIHSKATNIKINKTKTNTAFESLSVDKHTVPSLTELKRRSITSPIVTNVSADDTVTAQPKCYDNDTPSISERSNVEENSLSEQNSIETNTEETLDCPYNKNKCSNASENNVIIGDDVITSLKETKINEIDNTSEKESKNTEKKSEKSLSSSDIDTALQTKENENRITRPTTLKLDAIGETSYRKPSEFRANPSVENKSESESNIHQRVISKELFSPGTQTSIRNRSFKKIESLLGVPVVDEKDKKSLKKLQSLLGFEVTKDTVKGVDSKPPKFKKEKINFFNEKIKELKRKRSAKKNDKIKTPEFIVRSQIENYAQDSAKKANKTHNVNAAVKKTKNETQNTQDSQNTKEKSLTLLDQAHLMGKFSNIQGNSTLDRKMMKEKKRKSAIMEVENRIRTSLKIDDAITEEEHLESHQTFSNPSLFNTETDLPKDFPSTENAELAEKPTTFLNENTVPNNLTTESDNTFIPIKREDEVLEDKYQSSQVHSEEIKCPSEEPFQVSKERQELEQQYYAEKFALDELTLRLELFNYYIQELTTALDSFSQISQSDEKMFAEENDTENSANLNKLFDLVNTAAKLNKEQGTRMIENLEFIDQLELNISIKQEQLTNFKQGVWRNNSYKAPRSLIKNAKEKLNFTFDSNSFV